MKFSRRSVMRLAGLVGTGAAFSFDSLTSAGAATPVKVTLPWLPMGTFSYAFVAKKMGFWEKRGLDVTIDRGFGSGKVCVPVDQGQYDFGILDLGVMMNCAGRGLNLTAIAGIWLAASCIVAGSSGSPVPGHCVCSAACGQSL